MRLEPWLMLPPVSLNKYFLTPKIKKNPPAKQGTVSIPDSTRWRAAKPEYPWDYAPQQEKPQQWEAHELQLESRPSSLQLEKVHEK